MNFSLLLDKLVIKLVFVK